MAGAAIQKQLYKAYGSVAKIIGYDYRVYRPVVYVNSSVSTEDYVGTYKCSVSQDTKYSKAVGYALPLWETYVDGTRTQEGDILWNEDSGRYLMILSMQDHLPIYSIECPNTISIARAAYGDFGDGFEAGEAVIATDLKCNIQQGGAGSDSGLAPGQDSGVGENSWIVYFWMPKGSVATGDIITDEAGNRMEVRFAFYSHMGYRVIVREMKS